MSNSCPYFVSCKVYTSLQDYTRLCHLILTYPVLPQVVLIILVLCMGHKYITQCATVGCYRARRSGHGQVSKSFVRSIHCIYFSPSTCAITCLFMKSSKEGSYH